MKIAICMRMPTALANPVNFISSLIDLYHWCLANRHEPKPYFIQGPAINLSSDALLYWGKDEDREEFPELFNGQDYDYILWIDSDQVFNGTQLGELLAADKDIICAAIRTTDQLNGQEPKYAIWKDGKRPTVKEIDKYSEPLEVEAVGYGFTLVKKGVYEKIPYPWHKPVDYTPFKYSSEDDAFSVRAREAGFKLYVHPAVRVGHTKTVCI